MPHAKNSTPPVEAGEPPDDRTLAPVSHRRRSTAGAFLLMVGASGATGMSFINQPGSKDFGVPVATFLIYFSLFTLTSGVSMGVSGKLGARLGIKKVVIGGGILTSTAMVGMAVSPNLTVLYISALTAGFGWGACTVMAAAVVVNGWHTHNKRGTVLGIVMAGAGPGGMAWGVIMPPLIEAAGWRGGMLAIAASCLILIVLNGIVLISDPPSVLTPSPARATAPKAAAPGSSGLRWPVIALVTGAFILSVEAPVYTVLPAILAAAELPPVDAGALVSIFAFCLIFAPLLLGCINDKAGIRVMVGVNGLGYVIAFPLLALATGFAPAAIAMVALAVALTTMTVAVPLVVIRTVGPDRFSKTYAIVMMVTSLGMASGAPLWGLSFDLTGNYTPALYIAPLAAVLALVLMTMGTRRRRNPA